MKFQAILSAIVVAIASAKKFIRPTTQTQWAQLNNNVDSNANSDAINCAVFGDANALSYAQGANCNIVSQDMGKKYCY